jgi:autotransporter family porin
LIAAHFRPSLPILVLFLLAGCGGGGGSSSSDSTSTDEPYTGTCGLGTAVYALAGGSSTVSSPNFNIVAETDRSAFCAQNSGTSITLVTPTINSTATSSSATNSSLYGLGTVILAYGSSATTTSGGTVTVSGGTISTTSDNASGAFASGKGATVTLASVDVYTTGAGAHAVAATQAGAAMVTGSTTLTSAAAEVVVLEGASTMTISNSTLIATNSNNNRGIYIYGSTTTGNGASTLSISGGNYVWSSSTTGASALYIYNQVTTINLTGVAITNPSTSALLRAVGGTSGSGVTLNAIGQTLNGDIVADAGSTITLSLIGSSSLSGAINAAATAGAISITLETGSLWTPTGNSYVTELNATTANFGSTAYVVYYRSSATGLSGTHSLAGGGQLIQY